MKAAVLMMWTAPLFIAGCSLAPKYERPPVQTSGAYKEIKPGEAKDQWKTGRPKDEAIKGPWWQLFDDPDLDALEKKTDVSNQNIASVAAAFLEARAVVKEARSQYFPTVTAAPGVTRSRLGTPSALGPPGATFTEYTLPFDASWEPDLWGRVRNTVKANVLAAQASAADLENMRLSVQAELAVDYYELRNQDALKPLLDATVTADEDALKLTQTLYKAGLQSDQAVAQAEELLKSAQVLDTNLGILRAQYEHAIAVLVGDPPSSFSIPAEVVKANPPTIPVGLPSQLLERRPDIASAERAVAAANARIGVAKSAYFPDLTLSAAAGFEALALADWFSWPSRFWAVGAGLSETLFDGGLRRATVSQYRAAYDLTVANYRQTVLAAFQQVEDNLSSLRVLSLSVQQQCEAVQSAQRYLDEANVRYKAGLDPYLNVIAAQITLSGDQQAALNLQMQQMTASVQLIKALGGGWDASRLPPSKDM
jgi:NodT family efflux transporter outer membrane factor (OMF) lipoprotein